MPNPIAAYNQWSCTLACVAWFLAKNGTPTSQEDIVFKLGVWFPEWFHRPGLMERGDILNLFSRLGIAVRKFVHLNEKDEVLKIINKYYADYLAGFVLTRKPTNHCLAIAQWDANTLKVMEPHTTNPAFHDVKWDDLLQQNDADIFWLFK